MAKIVTAILWLVSAIFVAQFSWQSYTGTYTKFPDSGSGNGSDAAAALLAAAAAKKLLGKPQGGSKSEGDAGDAGSTEEPSILGQAWESIKGLFGGGGGPSAPAIPEPVAP